MAEPPLVTIIAVCYNHERFVAECLDHIRAQDYPHVQIVIVDDCSRDGSVRAIREWIAASGIDCQFIAHERNQGVCRTFNEAVRLARGKYISLIATDDTWMPDKISRQVALMEALPDEVGVLYSDAYQIDEHGRRLPQTFIEAHRRQPLEGDLFDTLAVANFIPAMTTLIRRSVFDRVGPYDERLVFEDFDFWMRAAEHYRFAFSDVPSACYRVLQTSMVRTVLTKEPPAVHLTYFLIHRKALASPRLGAASRAVVTDLYSGRAVSLYKAGHPYAARALLSAFGHKRRRSLLTMALCAGLGISHRRYIRTSSYLQWRFVRQPRAARHNEGPKP